jgi:hypothetical protein
MSKANYITALPTYRLARHPKTHKIVPEFLYFLRQNADLETSWWIFAPV